MLQIDRDYPPPPPADPTIYDMKNFLSPPPPTTPLDDMRYGYRKVLMQKYAEEPWRTQNRLIDQRNNEKTKALGPWDFY
jgi:hypothetical protein